MSKLVRQWIPFIIFLPVSLIVLLGYLVPVPGLLYLRDRLVEWAIIVAAFALLLGTFNILHVHVGQIRRRSRGWLSSFALLLAMLIGMIPPLLPKDTPLRSELNRAVLDYVLRPVGASLTALIFFTLTLAAFRLLHTRRTVASVLFLLVVILVLAGSVPLEGMEQLTLWRAAIIHVPAMAGVRGLLFGVALGTVIAALYLIIGGERPYGES
mgnify:CR=1 FL=1